jgi:hypothetical protein
MTTPHTDLRHVRAGRIVSALVITFMVFDGVTKLLAIDPVVKAMAELQWPAEQTRLIGAILLACTAAYIYRRTTLVGAILLTAFLGGATAAKARIDELSLLFSVVMGVLVWLGLYLRDRRIRELVLFFDRPVDPGPGRLSSR